MKRSFLAAAAAIGFLAMPSWGQDAAPDNQQVREGAIQSAQGLGIQNVQALEGAFVLEGTSAQGTLLLMVVGPGGELLALANPIAAPVEGGGETAAAAAGAGSEPAAGEEAAGEPEAGEQAESGFMETQAQPASPQMWDPALVEGAMQSLGAGGGAQAEPQQ